jgi:hypothetical protein
MELIWSNDGVSTLLLPAKILLFPEEKENKSTKKVKNVQGINFPCRNIVPRYPLCTALLSGK